MTTATNNQILEMKGIVKRFPGTLALDHVNFELRSGEVHALLGENGAGKSTLMKILSGAYVKDEGTIIIDGKEEELGKPSIAQKKGVAIIYQELTQIPQLSATENIFLGREKKIGPLIDWKSMHAEARRLLDSIDADFSEKIPTKNLSVAHKQMIEIAKALSLDAKIIIMDEPTSSLTAHEVEKLFNVVRKLREQGKAMVFITHHLEEITEISDRATILRDGKYIATINIADHTIDDMIEMMVGRALGNKFPKVYANLGEEVLRVENLSRAGMCRDINFSLRKGEVLGLAGLVGAGRTEVCRLIFGAELPDSGNIYIEGKRVDITSPASAIANGIGFLTENRKDEGLLLHMSIKKNISLPILGTISRGPFSFIKIIDHKKDDAIALEYYEKLNIRAPSVRKKSGELSGGNQQKVIFAKWIALQSKILIIDEPTRGIDVGAKIEIYNLINNLAEQGVGIIMVSSELPEVIGMSDRILVMCDGKIKGELTDPKKFTQEEIMKYATQFGKEEPVNS